MEQYDPYETAPDALIESSSEEDEQQLAADIAAVSEPIIISLKVLVRI